MIHIYTGNGKGKTTAAYGLCMRARGWKKKACIIQFLKSKGFIYGEATAARKLGIKIVCLNQKHPLFCKAIGHSQELKRAVPKSLAKVRKIIVSREYEVIVLDEIINALGQGYLKQSELFRLLRIVPDDIELVLTGRGKLPGQLIKLADYITNMQELKHPFRNKILARRGVEF